ncbi:MAG: Crp/Fnr family transcriptional regulator [Dorea sp.]|jgi:CRP/FNR family cyclic AMP-dependent transcriptional regulator|nr:Crp/Fnr family transcriptional regulator [Dorea sp.]
MDVFKELPLKKQVYMEMLFQNCTEEVKYYMSMAEVQENQTLIEAGERCSNIYIILSGKVTGIEWPMTGRPYFFKDYGPGDFFGEIEYFADLLNYRISVVTVTRCRVLIIPVKYYMEWLQSDAEALYLRTKENMRRLISQTADARKYLFIESRERLMMHLIRKYEQKLPLKKVLELRQSREQLSEEIGFSVKTLNRNIKKLEKEELICLQKGKIIITEAGYLKMKQQVAYHISGEV